MRCNRMREVLRGEEKSDESCWLICVSILRSCGLFRASFCN